ncbi:MAG: N(4)-(beta-N-acetylglucosaminyl)-L-asparaginase [Planctomycetota bacterium]|nr:N(4)-(beta-N-acetylglucosaminyl)-L-asparaginase [Planctomycetota bacterium]
MHRRDFLLGGVAAGAGLLASPGLRSQDGDSSPRQTPIIISTWPFGEAANEKALSVLREGGSELDAVEQGVMTAEANPGISTVGYGGFPNRDGEVQLDAAICDGTTRDAGAVCALTGYRHPVQVARKVMEQSPHLMLVGKGADLFARSQGFDSQEILSEGARKAYQRWREKHPKGDGEAEGHDTLGQIVMGSSGTIAAACTSSGMAWKQPGRVGDSPIIGHGLYADNQVGGCVATGVGEEISKVCGSFLVVELMRQGASPDQAIEETLDRIIGRVPANKTVQAAFVALRRDGVTGAGSIGSGFQYAITRGIETKLVKVDARVQEG